MEQVKKEEFEFTLLLNDKIAVKRDFVVNWYNPKAHNSMNFKYAIDDIVNIIKNELRNKASDYMVENQYKYDENPSYDKFENKDVFKFVVKAYGNEIARRHFDADIYPSTVRYNVDIRKNIYTIIREIQRVLSTKNNSLELTYLNYDLV